MVPVTKSHAFLEYENRITIHTVKKGKTDKICEQCGDNILIGVEHKVHTFIPGYESYPTHLECSIPFAASLI